MNVRQVHSILQHRKFPYMLANIDGVVIDPVKGEGIFEAKTAGLYSNSEWEKGLPDEYAIQVQHYLAVTGLSFAYIAVLIGGNKFLWKYIERDEGTIDLLIQLEARFWKLVQTNTPPPIDGSKASTELLNRLYPHAQKTELQLQLENSPDILTVIEAAQILRVGKNRMYELCKIEGFPKIILGSERGIRIPKQALIRWIEIRITNGQLS
jgi:predicted phage-related endonuclease